MTSAEKKPSLLGCVLLILQDGCPPEQHMQLCSMGEDPDYDCTECWERYAFYVANGRRYDPYAADRKKPALKSAG